MFKIKCNFQNYEWGNVGRSSKVFQLSSHQDFECNENLPYAEFWMGDYQDKSAVILHSNNTTESLYEHIQKNKNLLLGAKCPFDSLPFLFKVLSVRKALSIQAHPDLELARKLHQEKPAMYRDPNHKPELMVALGQFQCLLGFRPLNEIRNFIKTVPELANLLGEKDCNEFFQLADKSIEINDINSKIALRYIFTSLMNRDASPDVENNLNLLLQRISQSDTDLDKIIKAVSSDYPGDIGVFCIYFLNYLTLKTGEGVFLGANEPHAYLKGDCMECMARSDNVVRAGLTPKYKDVDTLASMLTYRTKPPVILEGNLVESIECNNATSREYRPPVEEFFLLQSNINPNGSVKHVTAGPTIFIVLEGSGSLNHEQSNEIISEGSTFFIHPNVAIEVTNTGTTNLLIYEATYQIQQPDCL
jgi:mannose-6-phosphate isomerase